MMNALSLYSEKDQKRITTIIAEAEKQTSGEIVPVVATRSGRYDRSEDCVGVILACIAMAGVVIALGYSNALGGAGWGQSGATYLWAAVAVAALLIAFSLGAIVASRFPSIALPFISSAEMTAEVERAAREQFQRLRIRSTGGATGVLIYISLLERQVHVLGDDAISEKLSQADWDAVRDTIVQGMRSKAPVAALEAGIHASGNLLRRHFPAEPNNMNELRNELHLIP
ncbi:MAG: TPM domain-containing protein [Pseudomonadota bacterium]